MNTKHIERIIEAPAHHFVGDGFRVHNFIPSTPGLGMHRMDPFIMLDYNSKFYFPPSDTPRGVSVHPHRGFETVTISYNGKIAHHDSAGNSGVIGEGDVQWMTAASGILHKEYHEKEFSSTGGDFQMVQLWVNLPAKDKMSKPKYQGIKHNQLSKIVLPNDMGVIEVIAGQYRKTKGPASTHTPIHLSNIRLKTNGEATYNFPASQNTAILIIEGKIIINEESVVELNNFGLFKNVGDTFSMRALEDSIVLVLSGEPINEPIAAYGPFVMNTKEELSQAINDFNTGKFGYLEE